MFTVIPDENSCRFCDKEDWEISATIISCRNCGVVYGRVNGHWVLDINTAPDWEGLARELVRIVENPASPYNLHWRCSVRAKYNACDHPNCFSSDSSNCLRRILKNHRIPINEKDNRKNG